MTKSVYLDILIFLVCDGTVWSGERNNNLIECLRDVFLIQKVIKPVHVQDTEKVRDRPTLDDLVLVSDDNLVSDNVT